MAPPRPKTATYPAPPDDLCLRFANTRSWRGTPEPSETLQVGVDVLRWAERECGLPPELAGRLGRTLRREAASGAAFTAAIQLREAIFRLFVATAAGKPPTPADLDALNAALAAAPRRAHLAVAGSHPGWTVQEPAPSLTALLAPVLWSAGDLLLGPRAGRVRQCANPACQWLFLDDSKSGNRRWCSMTSCGNRAKAHRHYLRQKQAQEA